MIRLVVISCVMVSSICGMSLDKGMQATLDIAQQAFKNKNYEEYFRYIDNLEPQLKRIVVNLVIDEHNHTPLHLAAKDGSVETVKKLLTCGANNDARTKVVGAAPLHIAAQRNNVLVIECLLDNNANIGAKASGTEGISGTPLHFAAQSGALDAIKYLVKRGAKIEASAIGGYTPLHIAINNDRIEAIFCLYKLGASFLTHKCGCLDCRDTYNKSALELALVFQKNRAFKFIEMIEVLQMIATDANPQAPNKLRMQLTDRYFNAVLHLLDINNCTLLMKASCEDFELIVQELLEDKRTDLDIRGPQDNTALHFAAQNGHVKVVSLLRSSKRANINSQNAEGDTPLHLALGHDHDSVVDELRKEPTINLALANKAGITPLQLIEKKASLVTKNPLSKPKT